MSGDGGGGREGCTKRVSLSMLEKRAVVAHKDRHPTLKRDELVDFCLLKFNKPVSRAAITCVLKDAKKIRDFVDLQSNNYTSQLKRLRRGNVEGLEKELLIWIQERQKLAAPISDALLIDEAKKIGLSMREKLPAKFNYSNTWLGTFKKKNGVNLRKIKEKAKDLQRNSRIGPSADVVSDRTCSSAVDLGNQRNGLDNFLLAQHAASGLRTMEESSQAAEFVNSFEAHASSPRACPEYSVGGPPAPVGAMPLPMSNALCQVTGLPAGSDLDPHSLPDCSNERMSPEEKPARKRNFLTVKEKREILEQRETNPSVTRQKLVEYCRHQFGKAVSKAAVTKIFQNKEEIRRVVDEVGVETASNLKRMRRSSVEILERPLATWCLKQEQNSSVTDERILNKAKHLGEHMKDELPDGFSYSRTWLLAFKRRHGVNSKKPRQERNKARHFTSWKTEDIKKFISEPSTQLEFDHRNDVSTLRERPAAVEKDEVKQAISTILSFTDLHPQQLGKYKELLVSLHSSIDSVTENT